MEITNEIKAKVFAQYLGKPVYVFRKNVVDHRGIFKGLQLNADSDYFIQYKLYEDMSRFCLAEIEYCELILKPLSKITDEDAHKVALMIGMKEDNGKQFYTLRRTDYGVTFATMGSFSAIFFNGQITVKPDDEHSEIHTFNHTSEKIIMTRQYLQSRGYDMPNYLLGGKTLHESGLAIYEN